MLLCLYVFSNCQIGSEKMIFKLIPAYKGYLWGGNKLKKDFNKDCEENIIAESWELSCHKDGQSTIGTGKFKGKTLKNFLEAENYRPLGENCVEFSEMPVLIKLIDANKPLSIQVHPDDYYAKQNEGQSGKTEMWYVLDAEPDSKIYYGFNRNITKEEFLKRIEDKSIMEVLNAVEVKKGDVFFLEPGTVHAIGAGIVVAEVQESSNVTYRIYDYDRKDSKGNHRELHVNKAVEVLNFNKQRDRYRFGEHIAKCKYFTVDEEKVNGVYNDEATEDTFHSLLILKGCGKIQCGDQSLELKKGDSIFICAGSGEYTIEGRCNLIKTTVEK